MLTYDGSETTAACDEFAALFVDDFLRSWDDGSCQATPPQDDARGWEQLAPSVFEFPAPMETFHLHNDGSYVITSLSDDGLCSSPTGSFCSSAPASNSPPAFLDPFVVDSGVYSSPDDLNSLGDLSSCSSFSDNDVSLDEFFRQASDVDLDIFLPDSTANWEAGNVSGTFWNDRSAGVKGDASENYTDWFHDGAFWRAVTQEFPEVTAESSKPEPAREEKAPTVPEQKVRKKHSRAAKLGQKSRKASSGWRRSKSAPHVEKKPNEQERPFVCHHSNCGKEYAKSSHLKTHMRRHTGEKPFKCSWSDCKWKFSRSDELARHVRSHNGQKPYPCDLCPKRFSRSDHLAKHKRVHMKAKLPHCLSVSITNYPADDVAFGF